MYVRRIPHPRSRIRRIPHHGSRIPTSLKPRHQVKLPEPAAAWAVQRTHVIDLGDGVAEEIDARGGADARHRLAVATGERRTRRGAPRHTGVAEHGEFDREWPVEAIAAKRSPQRE